MNDIRPFIRNIAQSVFKVKLENHKDISMPVVLAVGAVEDAVKESKVDESSISGPIVSAIKEASASAVDAIISKEIPNEITVKNFPEYPEFPSFDVSPVVEELKKLYNKEDKDIIFNEKEVDFKPVVEAIKSIDIPDRDYSEELSGIKEAFLSKNDDKIVSELKKLVTSKDMSVVVEWLKALNEKEYPVLDLPRDKDGIPYFNPTRVGSGGGGGGLTAIQEEILSGFLTSVVGERSSRLAINGDYIYEGNALPGTDESSPLWQISRFEKLTLTTLWADGNTAADNVWSDYLTLSYS